MNQQAPLNPAEIEKAIGIGRKAGAFKYAKRLLWALGLLALLAAGTYWYMARQEAAATITYQTVPAAKDKLTITVSSTGTIQPITQVDVGSELSGVVRDVLVDDNSIVKTGDVLARLDTRRLEAQRLKAAAQLQAAEARLQTANASLNQSVQSLTRQQTLRLRGLSTTAEFETATAEQARATANRNAAEADIATARADLELVDADLTKTVIVSPIDGMVLKRTVEPGQTVAASLQAPILFTIAQDLTRIQLEANVDEADVGVVKVGQSASFTVDAYRDRDFPAKIERMTFAPETVDGVVTYKTILSAENNDLSLRPGMTATAKIVVAEFADALTVPNEALRYSPPAVQQSTGFSITQIFMPRFPRNNQQRRVIDADGLRSIYVLENDQPKEVKVKLGESDGKKTLILEGDVKDGDKLVVSQRTGNAGGKP
jgi:HlyD family secretion protein